jgi:hypothetical protein
LLRRDLVVTTLFIAITAVVWTSQAQAVPSAATNKIAPSVRVAATQSEPVPIQAVVVTDPAKAGDPVQIATVHPVQMVFTNNFAGSVEFATNAEIKAYCQEASTASDLESQGWAYLYAICQSESSLGSNPATSVAGAEGPMQFLPATWAEYGSGSIYDLHDSIMAAGRMLRADGAPGGWGRAIFCYNHSNDYVQVVLARASHVLAGR